MRIRQKEIRIRRKREEERLKAAIKAAKAAKAAPPSRTRTRRTTA
jgi:hypothetical protein